MATSTPYNVANGTALAGSTAFTLTVGSGTGSPVGTAAGDMVYVLASDGLNEIPVSVTDSQGNTYTSQVGGASAQQHPSLWTATSATALVSGTDTITVTFPSSTGNKFLVACGASGVSATVDKSNSNSGNSAAPSSGGSGVLSQASELVVGCIKNAAGGLTPTGLSFGTGLTLTQGGFLTEFHQVVTATTAKTASGTITSAQWGALVGTFEISLPVVSTTGLPNATSGSAYSQTLSVSGGLPAYTWSITSGTLTGSGLTLSSAGVISGTATGGAASYPITVQVSDGNANTATKALTVTVTGTGFTRVQAGAAATGTGSVSPVITASTAGNLLVAALSTPASGQFTAPAGWLNAVQAGGGGGLMGEHAKGFAEVVNAGVTGMSTAEGFSGDLPAGTVPANGVPASWPSVLWPAAAKIQNLVWQSAIADTISGNLDSAHLTLFSGAPAGSWLMPYHEPGVGANNNPLPGPSGGGAPIGDMQAIDRHLIALKNRNYPSLQYGRGVATLGGNVDTSVWLDYGQSFTATNAAPCVFTSSPNLDAGNATAGNGSPNPNGLSVILKGGSIPAGFTANTVYYVVNASGTTFQLAATIGGTGITSTSTGSGTVVPVPDFYGMDGYQHNNQNHAPSDSFNKSYANILTANPAAKIAIIETGTAVGSIAPMAGQPTLTPLQGVTAWCNALGVFVQANPAMFNVNTWWAPASQKVGGGSQNWDNSFKAPEQALSNVMAAGGSSDVEIWYYPNCPAGITTATFTGPAGANCRGAIAEFSSPAGTSQALDGPGGATGAAAPPLVTSLPVTAQTSSAAGDLGIAVFGDFFSANQSGSWTTPSGWTLNASFAGSGTGANLFAFYEKTGLGSGVQSVTGTYSVSAAQTSWAAAVATFSQVFSSPVITTSSLPGGTVGVAYPTTTMTASGGVLPLTWSVGAGSPAGLVLSSAGVWSGIPTTAKSYTFTVTVTDQNGATGSKQFTAVVVASAVTIATSGLPGGTVGTPYSAPNMAAAGGTAPYTWAVTSGTLPAGVALSSGGVWSGTPTTAATYGFTIGVTDANGSTASGSFGIIIAPSGPPPPPPPNTAFPGSKLGILVELQVNGTWNDITRYVYVRDGINITGGTSQQGTTPTPANCTMTLNNRDGRFSPGTAGSIAAWGGAYLIRNMQLRVSVTATSVTGVHYQGYRFWGVVSQWPPQSDISGNDAYVQISADGPLRQISQGGGKGGALVRYYHSLAGTAYAPVAYWPCEDDTNALFIGSGVFNGQVMTITGTPLFKGISSFNGSAPMGVLNKSTWTGLTGSFGTSGDDEFTVPGTYTWVASTALADIRVTGGGGGGSGSAGNGGAGGASSVTGSGVSVTAAGGQGGQGATGGAGGTGSGNTTHFHGGAGAGAGPPSGGGGGGSGGSAAVGNPGSGTTGGAAVTDGGAGGNGGAPGQSPGGGGGGSSGPLGAGGGGGEWGEEPAQALTAGRAYTVTVGAGGTAGSNAAGAGSAGQVEMVYQASDKGTLPPINVVRFLMQVPVFGGNNGAVLLRFLTGAAVTGSNLTKLDVVYVSPGKIQLKGYTGGVPGTLNFTSGSLTVGDGQPVMVSVELQNNTSGGVHYNLRAIIPGAAAALGTTSGTVTSSVTDNVTQVIVAPNGDVTKTAIGHITVQAAFIPLTQVSDALNGHFGEMGIDRFIRLCAEQSLGSGVQFAEQSDHWGFEGGVQSWTGTNATVATSAFSIPFSLPAAVGWPSQGTQSLLATSTAVGAFSAQSPGGTAGQPVNPGDIVTAGADVVTSGAGVTAAYLGIQFWTAPAVGVGSVAIGTPVIVSAPIALTANTPVTLKAKTAPGAPAGAPAGAATFSLVVGNSDAASAAGTVLYVDNVRVSPRMGTQTREAYQDYLAQIHDLEQGLMKEAKTFWGLAYKTRITLFNQPVAVKLDYSLAQVAPPLQPVQDDKLTVTDVTVKRSEGSRVTVSQSAGQLTTGLPPTNGVPAPVAKQVKVVAEDDAQLIALADHLLSLGTDTSTRYPVITANLARTSTAPLFAAIASAEIGDRIQIINLPGFYPEATADQLIIGYTETLNYNVWTIAWNCTPASPWNISITNTRRW